MIFSSLWAACSAFAKLGRNDVPLSLRYGATMLCIGRKIAQAALQFRRISSHCLNIAANLE